MASLIPMLLTSNVTALTSRLDVNDILAIALRLTLVGLFAAGVRKLFAASQASLKDYLFPTAHIPSSDPSFAWILSHLAQSPAAQAQLRSFRLSTADNRQSKRDDANRLTSSKAKKDELSVARKDATFGGELVGQVLPVNGQSVRLRHNGHLIWVTRRDKAFAGTTVEPKEKEDHLEITGLVFQHAIRDFLGDAHAAYFKKSEAEILVFNQSPYNGVWYDPIARPSRPWKSVIIPEETKNHLLEDVRSFLSDEEKAWYGARGIPRRRGYLLHGPPGSGKTSVTTAIASELQLDIYIVNPAARGMDDGKLNKAFRNCPPQNMILIEDIDCVMPTRPRNANEDDDDEEDAAADDNNSDPGRYGLAKSTVTLSGVLNAVDGVSSQEDCILIATTNHPERLDPALLRPGRFDVSLCFGNATPDQARDLFLHFFPYSEFGVDSPASASPTVPPALQENEKSDPAIPTMEKEKVADEKALQALATQFSKSIFHPSPPLSSRGKDVTDPEVDKVDFTFEISMAAIQGFLLRHKKSPRLAAVEAEQWAAGLHREQEEKAQKFAERRRARELARAVATATVIGTATEAPLTPVSPSA